MWHGVGSQCQGYKELWDGARGRVSVPGIQRILGWGEGYVRGVRDMLAGMGQVFSAGYRGLVRAMMPGGHRILGYGDSCSPRNHLTPWHGDEQSVKVKLVGC